MNNEIDKIKKRLIYRSQYRGTKEMDKLIGSFVSLNINKFDINQLNELEKFLEIDDDTLYKIYNEKLVENNFNDLKIVEDFKKFEYEK